jgi:anti-sigma factor RsiW
VADPKPPPDDADDLTAYLDGELDPGAAESMATRLTLDPKLRAEADALQRAWDILDVLPRPQPSASFTTRTMTQAVPAFATGQQTVPIPGSTTAPFPVRKPGPGFWLGSMVLVLAASVGGYYGHRALAPPPRPVTPEPPLEDVTLLKNLRLYRNVDDVEYLKKLDSPELFGEDGE